MPTSQGSLFIWICRFLSRCTTGQGASETVHLGRIINDWSEQQELNNQIIQYVVAAVSPHVVASSRRNSSCVFEIVAWRTRVQACCAAPHAARSGPQNIKEMPRSYVFQQKAVYGAAPSVQRRNSFMSVCTTTRAHSSQLACAVAKQPSPCRII